MNNRLPVCLASDVMLPPVTPSHRTPGLCARRTPNSVSGWAGLLAGLFLLWFTFSAPVTARAGVVPPLPPGCTGSGLGINLFASSPDVHIGDTLKYSVEIYNGIAGSELAVCDATQIQAAIVTPDGRTNLITLRRTTLIQGEVDFYADVVSYVVRPEDLLPDGTVPATAIVESDLGLDTTVSGGARRPEVKTEVWQPCIQVTAACVGGPLAFTGTVSNCGNAPLDNVTVSNVVNGGAVRVIGPISLDIGESVTFSGSLLPADLSATNAALFVATGTDNLTFPRTVSAQAQCTASLGLSVAAPRITAVTFDAEVATVTWDSSPGATYLLQCKGNALDSLWIDIPGLVTASGTTAAKTDVVGAAGCRFYRVITVE